MEHWSTGALEQWSLYLGQGTVHVGGDIVFRCSIASAGVGEGETSSHRLVKVQHVVLAIPSVRFGKGRAVESDAYRTILVVSHTSTHSRQSGACLVVG